MEFLQSVQRLLPQSQLFSGALELNDRPLHEQIMTIVKTHHCRSLAILPLFLQPGTHVLQDLPAEVQKAQAAVQFMDCQLRLLPYLGANPALQTSLKSLCATDQPWILVAHGSTHPQAQIFFTQLHQTLGTHAAYWQHAPTLQNTLETLLHQGQPSVGLLPYFLFPGKITDTILQQFCTLQHQYKHVNLRDPAPLLSQHPSLAAIVAQILCTITEPEPGMLDKI